MTPVRRSGPSTSDSASPHAHRQDDQTARERITTELDVNMLVEAGAGSGKTTALVRRMLALVARGTPVDRIAAVTFTRKAASELRERFQLELEQRIREEPAGTKLAARYDCALRELDRAFLGTIHSFCARILRERPLEVMLDPNFREVAEEEWAELRRSFWRRWIERTKHDEDPRLLALHELGVDPRTLHDAFELVVSYPDVDFAFDDAKAPDVAPCRRALEGLLAKASALMPREEPADGWDDLMGLVRRLNFHRHLNDWNTVPAFCAAIERIAQSHCKLTQKRWSDTKEGKVSARSLGEEFRALLDGEIAAVLRCWREHRYPVVMRFLLGAADAFARERRATGQLGFEDLLLLAASLLREHPAARDELGSRYAHLLVDEFQDTDPVQAEVCFLLASPASQGSDWRRVVPRPGSLFVVGDPKQSIYRFRRADIRTYELVRQRIAACGVVLVLDRNFRSGLPIEQLVNEHFRDRFPAEATAVQAPFTPMRTIREPRGTDGVYHYRVRPAAGNKAAILDADSTMVASWIAARVASGERSPGDFLVLTATKYPIESYARALGERNLPVATTGAHLPQEHELEELLVVLRAVADPENAVQVVAALEGLSFGLTPAELFDARQAGIRFGLTHRPAVEAHSVGRALLVLHAWWQVAQRHPADVLVERILSDTGLLFHAASQPLGDARAGALLHVVEALRAASILGASGIVDAMERIASLLAAEAADAPLRPGRVDAVRVMNLHRAKGLEAEVVMLAAPLDSEPWPPLVHVRRSDGERPTGGMLIRIDAPGGRGDPLTIAHPVGWERMAAEEATFAAAERDRLLYVAVTRPRAELVVARCERVNRSGPVPDRSAWSPLAPTLERLGAAIELPMSAAPGRRRLERAPSEIAAAVGEAGERVQAASRPGRRVVTVTESVKQEREMQRAYDLPAGGAGAAWGRAVHRTLEAMGRGRTGARLAAFIAAVAREEELTEARREALARLAAQVAGSEAWRRLTASGTPRFELSVMQRSVDGDVETLTEGVVDAAAMIGGEWLVVDWKSDIVDDRVWREREARYAGQVERYGAMLTALTGHPAHGRVERVRSPGG